MSNLAGGTLTPQSPQCPGRARQKVNIPPSAHEPYKSLKRFKLVDEFADSEINASFGKTVDAFSHE